jgi:hypothetical protein
MYTMQGVTAITTAGSNANVLTGQIYERAPFNGAARFLMAADAAGAARCTIYIGGRAVMQESPVSRVNTTPIAPDQVVATAPMRQGEQLTIATRDTGAAGYNLFWRVDLRPGR